MPIPTATLTSPTDIATTCKRHLQVTPLTRSVTSINIMYKKMKWVEKEPYFDQDQELECMDKTPATVDFSWVCRRERKW